MELTPGLGQGLSFVVDYNSQINDLHRREELDRRAMNDASAKAAMFAADSEFQNSMNQHDSPLIKARAKDTIRKMGEYRRNNPDLLYNPDKLIEFNLMKRDLKDNEDLVRGMSSDKNYAEYVKDLQEVAKNPQMHDTQAYENIKSQWDNYLKYGNQNGIEAATKEGKKAFLYSKPQDFVDLPAVGLKTGDGIKNYKVVKGNNIGEWWSEPQQEELAAVKQSFYQQHQRQIQVESQKLGLTSPQDIDKWVTGLISAGFKKNYNIGDANALWERNYKMQQLGLEREKLEAKKPGASYTPYDNFVDPKNKAGNIPVTLARKIWNDKPKMTLVGTDGTKIDLTGYQMNYDGRYVKNKEHTPFLLGKVQLPLEVAFEKGITSQADASGIEHINSGFLGQAKIETATDKDGKAYKFVSVDYHLPVNTNDVTARQMYNVQADVDKLVPASKDPYGGTAKVYEGTAADFQNAGYNEAQIQEGVRRGLIKLK